MLCLLTLHVCEWGGGGTVMDLICDISNSLNVSLCERIYSDLLVIVMKKGVVLY